MEPPGRLAFSGRDLTVNILAITLTALIITVSGVSLALAIDFLIHRPLRGRHSDAA